MAYLVYNQVVYAVFVMNLRPQSGSKERTLYRDYTRELDGVLGTRLSILYMLDYWSMLH